MTPEGPKRAQGVHAFKEPRERARAQALKRAQGGPLKNLGPLGSRGAIREPGPRPSKEPGQSKTLDFRTEPWKSAISLNNKGEYIHIG